MRTSRCIVWLLSGVCLFAAGHAAAQRCLDEGGATPPSASTQSAPSASTQSAPPASAEPAPPPKPMPAPAAPRLQLRALVDDALRQSDAVGAATLLADAADSDVDATRAAAQPQASLSGGLGPAGSRYENSTSSSGWQARTTVSVGSLIYDGGRNRELVDWRSRLAEAARYGGLGTREQVALQTVSLAVERSRYRLQAQINRQYQRKMACLVQALQEIVNADRGRNSELVQARKTELQAELLVQQSLTALKQVEIRMQRFVGVALPDAETAGTATLLLGAPPLAEVEADAGAASDIAALAAQAEAQNSLARSVQAEHKPQLSWTVSGSKAVGAGRSASWTAGLAINVPLLDPAQKPALDAARKRAEAARLQLEDALRQRRSRIAEAHEQATSAFDRARRSAVVMRDSDLLRNYTLQQWQQLGRRSLFDVMSAESEHYALRAAYVNALHDGQQSTALLHSLGRGIVAWLE